MSNVFGEFVRNSGDSSSRRVNNGVYKTLGASNHAQEERSEHDLYCTHPDAVVALLELEEFNRRIWEPCDGLGHMSDVLLGRGYDVRRSDLLTRGRDIEQLDFLAFDGHWDGDIITNPPYSCAAAIVRKALDAVEDGCKVAMWLHILFLESQERKRLFAEFPPRRVWISSKRIECGKNGVFGKGSPQGYAWFVWEKGYKGTTELKWF